MFKIPDANTTLSELAESAENFGAEIMSFCIFDERLSGRTFTVAVATEEAAKYLKECVSQHNETEEFETDGSDY